MQQITSGIIGYLAVVGLVHVVQFFSCDSDLPGTEDNTNSTFSTIRGYATFTECGGEQGWWSFIFFTIFTLPILLMIAGYLFALFNNAVTGTAAALLAVILGLLTLFGG